MNYKIIKYLGLLVFASTITISSIHAFYIGWGRRGRYYHHSPLVTYAAIQASRSAENNVLRNDLNNVINRLNEHTNTINNLYSEINGLKAHITALEREVKKLKE